MKQSSVASVCTFSSTGVHINICFDQGLMTDRTNGIVKLNNANDVARYKGQYNFFSRGLYFHHNISPRDSCSLSTSVRIILLFTVP